MVEKIFYPKNIQEWRSWLEKNHEKEKKVAILAYKKHTGKPSLTHKEAMHEAICFGWIDTTLKSLDENKYIRNFAKRSKNSKWSNNTLSYAKQLIKEKRMAPAGLAAYKAGLKKPTHDHGIPKNPNTPEDLIRELEKNKAKEKFNSLAPSYKRTYLRWLYRAKRPETRIKRINAIVNQTLSNNKEGIYPKKEE